MPNLSYLLILIGSIFFPLLFSFIFRPSYWSIWWRSIPATLFTAIIFIIWDYYATAAGHWAFSTAHTLPPRIWRLPLEEIAFFLVIPFAVGFIQYALHHYFNDQPLRLPRAVPLLIGIGSLILSWLEPTRYYTRLVLFAGGLTWILLGTWWFRASQSRHFWLSLALSYLPFFLVNGLLTAIPIVSYNPASILNLRLYTIPIEDTLYSFALLTPTLLAQRHSLKTHRPATI